MVMPRRQCNAKWVSFGVVMKVQVACSRGRYPEALGVLTGLICGWVEIDPGCPATRMEPEEPPMVESFGLVLTVDGRLFRLDSGERPDLLGDDVFCVALLDAAWDALGGERGTGTRSASQCACVIA